MSAPAIAKAAVIGAGVMGAGIAAHLANAGLAVVLLDVAEEGPRRSRRAEDAIQRQLAAGGFMHPCLAGQVTPGNVEDDLGLVADADWIVEAVAERIEIKRALFTRLDAIRKPGSIVSSNTSTLPLGAMTEGQTEAFARDFLVAHFFNPPRQMRLLELVAGPATRPEAVARIAGFADVALGKGVVACKDRPGFIANRIGCFWFAAAVAEAISLGLSVEEADAIIGRPFGIPPTGVFGLLDLVGLDLMPEVWGSLGRNLPAEDPLRRYDLDPPLLRDMIGRGLTGRKAGGGFYRLATRDGAKQREAFDLAGRAYRDLRPAALDSLAVAQDLRALLDHPDRGGRYAWKVMGPTLAYAASLIPEVAEEPSAADEAMRLGYAWSRGPFELIDAIGPAWFAEALSRDGQTVPPLLREAAAQGGFYRVSDGRRQSLRPAHGYRSLQPAPGSLSLAAIRLAGKPVIASPSAALWDLGEGVAGLEIRTKAQAIDPALLAMIETATAETGRGFQALVIGGDAASFSAGADLRGLQEAALRGDWPWVEALIDAGQRAFLGLKRAPFPVVAAVTGATLGGGCELALHCDAIQAHAEVSMGLVETKVGLVPGWGGCKELLLRLAATEDPSRAAFRTILGARASTSALGARDLGFLRPSDGITMNSSRLLADARHLALRLAPGYRPPAPARLSLPGPAAARRLLDDPAAAVRDPHDSLVAEHLARILTGGETDPATGLAEDAVQALERAAFLELIRRGDAQQRIQRILGPAKRAA